MRILVTGGSGFIGAYVVEAAEIAGHEVESFDRRDGNDILGDLGKFAEFDHVIHLAGVLGTAELFDDAENAVTVNTIGTLRVLQACERFDLGYTGITMPPVFPSVYTASKIAATRLATAWHRSKRVPVSHVRAFNAYGPGQAHGPGHPQKIVPTFATNAWNGTPLPIWGDGQQTVDLVHARDLGRMLVDATRFSDDETFDGGTGKALTVNEVAEYCRVRAGGVTGTTPDVDYLPMRDGETPTHIVATGEGWDLLGWRPEFSYDELGETVDAYKP